MKRTQFILLVVLLISTGLGSGVIPYQFPELKYFPEMPVADLNPVTVEGADLGRHLFYDPILSFDSTISCSGCHRQEVAFSDAPLDFSIGMNGVRMERNTLPLFNLAWHQELFWDGKAPSIEKQVFHPVRGHEMNFRWVMAVIRVKKSEFYKEKFTAAFPGIEIDSLLIAKAIAQFERTLLSYRSKYDQVLDGKAKFTNEEYGGFVLVNDQTKGDCLHCHTTDGNPLGSTYKFSNNGLDRVSTAQDYKDKGRGSITGLTADYGKFKIPSLRNVFVTPPYMHDGRFATLDEVLEFYSEGVNQSINIDSKMGFAHQGGARLSREEKQKIISFLKTLTDSAFIADQAFSNPF